MLDICSLHIEVAPDAIDENRHVNNREYLKWMQDVAVAHSAAVGWSMERYFRTGATWVVRSHSIEYLRPAYEGDGLSVHTWVAAIAERSSVRRYVFWRERDRVVVARAETLWVFVDLETGRPRSIPEALRADFALVPEPEEEVLERLELQVGG